MYFPTIIRTPTKNGYYVWSGASCLLKPRLGEVVADELFCEKL